MPVFKIFTSLARDKIPENFAQGLVPVLAKALQKPEEKLYILVSPDCVMALAGKSTDRPGAVASLESIGSVGLEQNKATIKDVTNYVQKELGIAPMDFMMSFYDLQGQNIGKGGKTTA